MLRYYYKGTVHESFMHFEHADKLDAAGLTEKKIVNRIWIGIQRTAGWARL